MTKDEALKPEQEPVAWMDEYGDVLSASVVDGSGLRNIPLYTTPPQPKPEQEPVCVAFIRTYVGKDKDGIEIWKEEPLYTTPPQRTWVGLTDKEMEEAMDYWSDPSRSAYGGAWSADSECVDMVRTWRYIEAKLKEKNGC